MAASDRREARAWRRVEFGMISGAVADCGSALDWRNAADRRVNDAGPASPELANPYSGTLSANVRHCVKKVLVGWDKRTYLSLAQFRTCLWPRVGWWASGQEAGQPPGFQDRCRTGGSPKAAIRVATPNPTTTGSRRENRRTPLSTGDVA
jgi:hypothetical protein